MSSRLINVRLDADRLRKALSLRKSGIALSDVVREAIDERYEKLRTTSSKDVGGLVRRLFDEHPDPPDLPPRDYDVHDRKSARTAIVYRIRRRR
jgi:hypothetical protein